MFAWPLSDTRIGLVWLNTVRVTVSPGCMSRKLAWMVQPKSCGQLFEAPAMVENSEPVLLARTLRVGTCG
jgi:hypothetical protein